MTKLTATLHDPVTGDPIEVPITGDPVADAKALAGIMNKLAADADIDAHKAAIRETRRAPRSIFGQLSDATIKREIAAAAKAGNDRTLNDGTGLSLYVFGSGSRSPFWRLRFTAKGGGRKSVSLGGYPKVSLQAARKLAQAERDKVATGIDPAEERRAERAERRRTMPTFREAARAVHEANLPTWRNAKHGKQFISTLERYAFPKIGKMPVDEIAREDVLRCLTPIWTKKPETARRVRQRIRTVLKWAQAHGHTEHNAAGEAIDGALPSMPKVKAHQRALPYRDVADALATVEESGAWEATKLCFRFAVLTAARSGEARAVTWAEIDRDAAVWTIPAERMKAGKAHRVPLSDEALAVLDRARLLSDGDGLIFPSARGKMLSDNTVSKLLRENGIDAVPHGFRSSFRDWCAETGKPREIAEAALAHTVGGVEGAYFRSDLFEARRRLMAEWARYLSGDAAKVVKLHA